MPRSNVTAFVDLSVGAISAPDEIYYNSFLRAGVVLYFLAGTYLTSGVSKHTYTKTRMDRRMNGECQHTACRSASSQVAVAAGAAAAAAAVERVIGEVFMSARRHRSYAPYCRVLCAVKGELACYCIARSRRSRSRSRSRHRSWLRWPLSPLSARFFASLFIVVFFSPYAYFISMIFKLKRVYNARAH